MQRLLIGGLAALVSSVLAAPLAAQSCDGAATLLINDNLGANPTGQVPVSIIQGLCEGEAAGCVFDVSSLSSPVSVSKAAVGLFSGGGASGNQIQGNLRIYDGISWAAGIPTLGPLVFDFNNANFGKTKRVISIVVN